MFSACRHPRRAAGRTWKDRCLDLYFYSTWVPWKKEKTTQTIMWLQIVGIKPKRKWTPDRLKNYAAAQKPHNFWLGENIHSLRIYKNKLISHWLILPLCRAVFGSWMIKLVLQYSESKANSNFILIAFPLLPNMLQFCFILPQFHIFKNLQACPTWGGFSHLAKWYTSAPEQSADLDLSFPRGSEQKRTGNK